MTNMERKRLNVWICRAHDDVIALFAGIVCYKVLNNEQPSC